MRKLILPLIVFGGLWTTVSAASAQGFGVEVRVGPAYGYADYGNDQRRGRYSGYGYGAGRAYVVRPTPYSAYDEDPPARDDGSCGTYFYWDGDRCVDARDK